MKVTFKQYKRWAYASGLALVLSTWGCGAIEGSKDEDENKTENAGNGDEPESSNPDATTSTAELDVGAPSMLLAAASATLGSADLSGSGSSLRLLEDEDSDSDEQEEEGDDQEQSANDPLCTEHGDPWDVDNDEVMNGTKEEAARTFYCLLNSGVVESTETIQGILAMQRSVICTVEENLKLTKESFTAEGTELVDGDEVMVTFSDKCWPQGKPDGMTKMPMNSVVATALPEDSGWHNELHLKSEAADLDMKFRFFNHQGIFGFSNTGPGTKPGVGESMQLVVDTNQGVLLFNNFNDRNGYGGADSSYRGYQRLRVKGTLDKDLKFAEITEGRGFVYKSGPGFSAESGAEHVFSAYTVDGTSEDGYQFRSIGFDPDADDAPEVRFTECSDGDCANAEAIGTDADMKKLFYRGADVKTAWEAFKDSKPMCEPAGGDSSSVDFSAAPPHVGNLGRCE